MHAGFPQFTSDLVRVLRIGASADDRLKPLLAKTGGALLSDGMALLLRLGFGFIMRDSLLDPQQAARARAFLEDNFVILDPEAPDGKRYYQGKFLIRTRSSADELNVFFAFCQHPERLFDDLPWGEALNPLEVVTTRTLTASEADELLSDPGKIDLLIQFKDAEAILELIGQSNVDIVGMLLNNVVQLKGNVGHLFKLGSIAANIQQELQASLSVIH